MEYNDLFPRKVVRKLDNTILDYMNDLDFVRCRKVHSEIILQSVLKSQFKVNFVEPDWISHPLYITLYFYPSKHGVLHTARFENDPTLFEDLENADWERFSLDDIVKELLYTCSQYIHSMST